jgi:hypothetical protein
MLKTEQYHLGSVFHMFKNSNLSFQLSESLNEKMQSDKDKKHKWTQFVLFAFVYRLETELRHVIDNKKVKESSTRAPSSEEQRIQLHRSKYVVHPGDCLYSAFACPIFEMSERAQIFY